MYIILFSALTDGTVSIMHPKTGDAPNNAQNTRLSLSRLLSPALMAEEQQQKAQGIPPRYDLNAKWDACLDITMRRLTYSSLAGAFTALLFFSESSPPQSYIPVRSFCFQPNASNSTNIASFVARMCFFGQ